MGHREGAGGKMFIFKCSMASFCYKNLAQTDFSEVLRTYSSFEFNRRSEHPADSLGNQATLL